MKFRILDEPVYSSDPLFDLFDSGYIQPEELLANVEDIDEVNEAIEIIRQFLDEAVSAGVLEVE